MNISSGEEFLLLSPVTESCINLQIKNEMSDGVLVHVTGHFCFFDSSTL